MPASADLHAIRLTPDLLALLFSSGSVPGQTRASAMAAAYLNGGMADGAMLTPETFAAIYRQLATDMNDEHLGVFQRPARPGALKFIMLALLDAPSLGVALHRYTHLFHVLFDDFRLRLKRETPHARISLHATDGELPGEIGQFLLLKLTHGIASWLVADTIPLNQLHFSFADGPRSRDYASLFPCQPQFDQPVPMLDFPRDYLDMPIRRRKPELRGFLARAPLDWIHAGTSQNLLSREVRRTLAASLPLAPDLDSIAARLGLSTRTLCRRLSEEGQTFQGIKNGLRRDIAIQRIAMTNDPIADIAAELGFDDPTAFYRAFRRWTGRTPGGFRQTETPAQQAAQ